MTERTRAEQENAQLKAEELQMGKIGDISLFTNIAFVTQIFMEWNKRIFC